MTPQQLQQSIDALLDGQLSEADFLTLEAELSVNPQARQIYLQRIELDQLLSDNYRSDAGDKRDQETTPAMRVATSAGPPRMVSRTLLLTILAAAACLLFATTLAWQILGNGSQDLAAGIPSTVSEEQSAIGFAVLSGQAQAVWKDQSLKKGQLIPSGIQHLQAGLIQLELFSGVQLVIQGDASFAIESPMQVRLLHGKARALVPEAAHGFQLLTSEGQVVDLGTEFSVKVDHSGTQVEVLEGEVELHPNVGEMKNLITGQRLLVDQAGPVSNQPGQPISVVGPKEMQNRLAKQQNQRLERWQNSVNELLQDPRLLGHYSLDGQLGYSRVLPNGALNQQVRNEIPPIEKLSRKSVASQGAIVAAQRDADRWGRDQSSLDFSPVGSRVRVLVPGEHNALTLMCWVKINSLDRMYNSLFLTDGHEVGEPHWQILADGRLFFSIKPDDQDKMTRDQRQQQIYHSPPFWDTSLSGKWIMLCTVYDPDQQQVTHYLNGDAMSQHPIPDHLIIKQIKIGAASICNWSEPMYRTDPTFVVRNLNGSIDEFAIFDAPLSGQEVKQLYQSGNPYLPLSND